MAYIENRLVHDADSHVMETPEWLDDFMTTDVARKLKPRLDADFGGAAELTRAGEISKSDALQDDTEYRARDEQDLMARKNYRAIGAFRKSDRPRALDLLGVASQLVFPTYFNVMLETLEHADDHDLLYGLAAATNRAQADFCNVDPRLLAVGYVPIANLERAPMAAEQAIKAGCKALLIPWACPKQHATSHIALDAVWARAEEAGIPIVLHVGAADFVLPKAHANNGAPAVKDFHGGDENFRSISYMAIPSGPMQALSMLILDGVLERHPRLKVGVIELGAAWVPGFMRQLDAAFDAFGRHEPRLQELSLKPSQYLTRQVRVTPYPTEPTGWIIEQSAPEICLFSSDYPHVEGGRNPYGRFENTTAELDATSKSRFYQHNFEDLMGPMLPS